MANKFQLTITAVDKATSTMRKINASMDRMTRPVRMLGQSLKGFGKEAGLDKVASAMGKVGKSASDVGGKLASILAPLGVIVGGGTITGIAALATEWGRLGSEIARSEAATGATGAALQSLRGANIAVGGSAEELTGGLKALGDTMEDSLYGRNQQALVMLKRLGVGIHHTATGSIDAVRGFKDLSSAIAGIKNAQVQGLVARQFGLESLLPLLRQGPQAIEAYEAKVRELGGVMSDQAVAAAQSFGMSMNYLSVATQGVRNTIGEKLLPILQPLIDGLTQWISQNRELIATRVAEFVEGLAKWVQQLDFNEIGNQMRAFGRGVLDVVDALGGWKNAAIGLVIIMEGSLLASVINLGLAIGKLTAVGIPALVRGVIWLGTMLNGGLVAALVNGAVSAAGFFESLASLASGIPIVGTALGGLSEAMLGLGVAIEATPVGWILTAIAAIAFGAYAIYKNWDSIVSYFQQKFDGVKAAFDKNWAGGILKALWEFSPIKILADTMNGLVKWLFGFDLYDAGRSIVAGLARGLKSVVGLLPKSVLHLLGLDGWLADNGEAAGAQSATKAVAAAVSQPSAPPQSATPAAAAVSTGPSVQTSAQSPSAHGVRNNNPGNLRSWGNLPRDAAGFAIFPSREAGLDAMVQNLRAQKTKHGLDTITGIVGRWAPQSDGNDTGKYVNSMVAQTGFGANQHLDLNDQRVVAPLISAIIKQEGNGAGFSQDMVQAAVASQLKGGSGGTQSSSPQKVDLALTVHGLPAGTSVSARTADGNVPPVKTVGSMPTGVTP